MAVAKLAVAQPIRSTSVRPLGTMFLPPTDCFDLLSPPATELKDE
jgi:hypothetical protein